MLEIQEYVDIKNYSTFKIGGQFRYFVIVSSIDDLNSIYAIAQRELKYENIPIFVLGGGSNIVFPDGVLNVIALKIEIKGFNIVNENNDYVDIKIGGGEIWDKIVEKTVEMNLSGFEALSAIPGTVGATPVQNVGAYGSEVKDTILEVESFDLKEKRIVIFSNQDCRFGYRDSIFKNEAKGKYIIISVTYRLSKSLPQIPEYPGVKRYFLDNNINNPHVKEIREAVIYIRDSKLPNWKELPNLGSFFKNPIVSKEFAKKLQDKYSTLHLFAFEGGMVKIPAGWLMENAGLKGQSFGNISVYEKNALVLVNNGKASKEDIIKAKNEIVRIVNEKFGIVLEQEPEMV
jgi:UDP-N-acetylmuramate dehydrogenase